MFPGNGGLGGGPPRNPNDPNDPEDPEPTATGTVLYNEMYDDTWASGLADPAAVDALYSSMYPPPVTTAPPAPTFTEAPRPPATPSPAAQCIFCDNGFFWTFEVYDIKSIKESDLRREENGCGALTGWDWRDGNALSGARVFFNLPFFMKAGCVERAIVSAGGPKISCAKGGICGIGMKAVLEGAPAMPVYTEQEMEMFLSVYGTNRTHEDYLPQIWSRK